MLWLDVLSRIVHVSTAIVLVGGSVFSLFVTIPSLAILPEDARRSLVEAMTGKWKRFVHLGVLLFLASGFYNYLQAIPNHKGDGLYHALLGTKMLLALLVFFIAAALVGRSQKLEAIRQKRVKWLRVLVLLAAIIVGISGFVKVRGNPATPAAIDNLIATENQ